MLRSGTEIGALIRESKFAQSKADFISKLSMGLKEANECIYWILLLRDSGLLSKDKAQPLLKENDEIVSMLVSSIKTLKGK